MFLIYLNDILYTVADAVIILHNKQAYIKFIY